MNNQQILKVSSHYFFQNKNNKEACLLKRIIVAIFDVTYIIAIFNNFLVYCRHFVIFFLNDLMKKCQDAFKLIENLRFYACF